MFELMQLDLTVDVNILFIFSLCKAAVKNRSKGLLKLDTISATIETGQNFICGIIKLQEQNSHSVFYVYIEEQLQWLSIIYLKK